MVTTFGRPGYLKRALTAGASGFVVKETPAAQLADAVRRVHQGLRVVDPALAMDSLTAGDSPLTARETEVLQRRPRRRVGGRHRLTGAPVGGHRAQPPVGCDRQDRRTGRGPRGVENGWLDDGMEESSARTRVCTTSDASSERSRRRIRADATSEPIGVQPSQAPPAETARNQKTTAAIASSGSRPGCGVHQRQAVTNSTSQTNSRIVSPHQGATSPEAAYRKNAAAIPAMPTNGHGEALARGRPAGRHCRVVVPVRVVVPLLVALGRLGEGALGLLGGGVGTEPVDGRADVLARLHAGVLDAVPELARVRVGHAANLRDTAKNLDCRGDSAGPCSRSPRAARCPPGIAWPEYVDRPQPERFTGSEVKDADTIERIRIASRLAAQARETVGAAVQPGVTTDELDRIGHEFLCDHGAYPSTLGYKGFPKSLCSSVNEVICHGIPDSRVVEDGDIVNIDITAFINGVHGDTNATFLAGDVDEETRLLVERTHEALMRGINAVKPGRRLNVVGRVIESYAKRFGYGVVRDFTGHGIGTSFHSGLIVPHYDAPMYDDEIQVGMTFTIEPMLNLGTHEWVMWDDGWTVVTKDGRLQRPVRAHAGRHAHRGGDPHQPLTSLRSRDGTSPSSTSDQGARRRPGPSC